MTDRRSDDQLRALDALRGAARARQNGDRLTVVNAGGASDETTEYIKELLTQALDVLIRASGSLEAARQVLDQHRIDVALAHFEQDMGEES